MSKVGDKMYRVSYRVPGSKHGSARQRTTQKPKQSNETCTAFNLGRE